MLNPFRPELEQLIFDTEESVLSVLDAMDASLVVINQELLEPSSKSDEVIQRNKDYILSNLAFETIRDSGVDLSKYEFLLS